MQPRQSREKSARDSVGLNTANLIQMPPFNAATRAFDAWLSRYRYAAAMSESREIWWDAPADDRSVAARAKLATFLRGVLEGAKAANDVEVAELPADAIDYTAIADKWLRGITGYEAIERT